MKKAILASVLLLLALAFAACMDGEEAGEASFFTTYTPPTTLVEAEGEARASFEKSSGTSATEETTRVTEEPTSTTEHAPTDASSENESEHESGEDKTSLPYVVVIDPGHQDQANLEHEPIGPGASETKMKTSLGTFGPASGLYEYELNLMVSLKLRTELERRGYTVAMTRESNDVDLGNIDRAEIANNYPADVFLRIHANGSDNPAVSGAMTICQTPTNPFNGALYSESWRLSSLVLDFLVAETGCKKGPIWETDTMTGINWSKVPVTIVEMGYMTNPEEDLLMASEAYQDKIVRGIANAVDAYFKADLIIDYKTE